VKTKRRKGFPSVVQSPLCDPCRDAIGKLYHAHIGLIGLAMRRRPRHREYDECWSVAVGCFIRCVRFFDPDRGYQFSSYATKSMKWAVAESGRQHLPFSGCGELKIEPAAKRNADSAETEDLRDCVREAIDRLPARQRQILAMRMGGNTLDQIAGVFGITRERDRQIVLHSRRLLREDLERSGLR
jgi:RNA polymerase sigma factor (sigma-70 family)